MGYYHNSYRRPKPETVPVSEELTARLERVETELKPHLTDWEQGFMESVTEAYKKWNGLTIGQHRTFEKIESKYDPATLAAKSAWAEGYDEEKRKTLKLVANYYRTTSYFAGLVAKIDTDPNFVPSESCWNKFVENKYAKKMLAAIARESNFVSGGFALLRDTFRPGNAGSWGDSKDIGRGIKERKGRTVLVLKQSDRLSTDKVWLCAYLDNPTAMWEVEERWLKKHRTVKKKS